jgi:glycosyltransferase involved in cell wall biosynthesis
MAAVRRASSTTRVALVVHEASMPPTSWKNAIMGTWQRWQLGALARSADTIFCTVQTWMRMLPDGQVRSRAVHLPVGSAIPPVGISREEARMRLGIRGHTRVLGVFGTSHPTRMLERVRDAATAVRRAGIDVLVLYIGPDPAVVRDRLRDTAVVAKGPLPADEVSRRLAAVDIYLTPFADGVSTRRTSLMAGLQHGLPTVGTRGAFTDAVLRHEHGRALLLADVADAAAFEAHVLRLLSDDTLRRRVGIEAQRLYEREFSWPRIARRMFATLAAGVGSSTALARPRVVASADGAPAAGVA